MPPKSSVAKGWAFSATRSETTIVIDSPKKLQLKTLTSTNRLEQLEYDKSHSHNLPPLIRIACTPTAAKTSTALQWENHAET